MPLVADGGFLFGIRGTREAGFGVDFSWARQYFSAMPEKSLSELPRDLRDLYQKGATALQRQNFDYAIAILQQVLQREPACLECRQALRAAQIKKSGGSTGFFRKVLGGASNSPLIAKAQMAKGRNPIEGMQIAEQILETDPQGSSGNKILAEAAMAANLPKTACFAYEILLKASPRDYDLSMAYGAALAAAGQIAKAETIYSELMLAHPQKGEVAAALKDLSARKTLNEGGYEALADGTGSYRDILRNKDEAVQLEQEKRSVRSDDVAENLIAEYESRLVTEPANLKLLRNIAELCAQKKEFDKSLAYYERIRNSESGADPSLEKTITETALRKYDHLLGQLDLSVPEQAEQAEQLKKERAVFQIEEVRKRAERYPTDLQIKFELGQLYFGSGKFNEAMAEFQKAEKNPQRRLQAMAYLGQCFAAKGMNEMAARRIQEALKEKPGFDDEKKELIYLLGGIFEKMGKKEDALKQYEQIYEVDIGYKDVAAKVEAFYSGQG
jgi:tetratricopeptide (TPR) repeat protein